MKKKKKKFNSMIDNYIRTMNLNLSVITKYAEYLKAEGITGVLGKFFDI